MDYKRDLDLQAEIFVMGKKPGNMRDVPYYSSDLNATCVLCKMSGVQFSDDPEGLCRESIIKVCGKLND